MGVFSLFELFLAVFSFYAISHYEGGMRIVVPVLCLFTLFLFERVKGRLKEDEEIQKRLLKQDSKNTDSKE